MHSVYQALPPIFRAPGDEANCVYPLLQCQNSSGSVLVSDYSLIPRSPTRPGNEATSHWYSEDSGSNWQTSLGT